MEIRDNVRRRRRERIEELLAKVSNESGIPSSPPISTTPSTPAVPPMLSATPTYDDSEADPEKWWKEYERRQRKTGPAWTGVAKLPPVRSSAPRVPIPGNSAMSGFAKSIARRFVLAAVLFGAAWGWFSSDLPGSREAKLWTVTAVTRDMDFRAAEAWYERNFGGSPAFLPIFRSKGETQAVSGAWNREQAVLPADGRIVQTFAQDGSGIRIAAPGGSGVKAVYAGRILQVSTEADGKTTVLVQHAGRIVTVYGNVASPAVKPGDWAEAGQRLGSIPAPLDKGGESLLYFAVKQNGKTLDPADVVPFD